MQVDIVTPGGGEVSVEALVAPTSMAMSMELWCLQSCLLIVLQQQRSADCMLHTTCTLTASDFSCIALLQKGKGLTCACA